MEKEGKRGTEGRLEGSDPAGDVKVADRRARVDGVRVFGSCFPPCLALILRPGQRHGGVLECHARG